MNDPRRDARLSNDRARAAGHRDRERPLTESIAETPREECRMSGEYASTTEEIVDLDRRHHLHPYQVFATIAEVGALPIAAGDGAFLTDTDGNRYLDAVGGMWCTNVGLGNEEMVEAIAEQVRTLAYANPFVDMTNPPAARLATKLAELAPGNLNHVFFTTGGSTAVDAAFRIIQFYNGVQGKHEKRHIISRIDAYHGSTYAAVSIGGKPGDRKKELHYIDDIVHHLSSPNYYRYGGDLTEQEFADRLVAEFEAKIEELGADKVAAFFAEPVMGSGGVIPPPADYLRKMWDVCRENDILYVSDEVVTGFGRLGEWFVSEALYGVQPDIITSAKGLTSGYLPLGAVIFSDAIWEVIEGTEQGYIPLGFTYSGHPVSCAAALKSIEIIEREGLREHVREIGPYLMEQLNTLRDLPMVGDVRGSHLMACVEFVADKETKEMYPPEIDIGKRVSDECDAIGLMVRPVENLNVMSPPLVITKEDVDFIVASLREAIPRAHAKAEELMYEMHADRSGSGAGGFADASEGEDE
jgi:adenosylmethionine-8-amino-7-oxononanoate aminotransferase